MTHGTNLYYFKVPYTEVMNGRLTISVSANTEKEAIAALLDQDWSVMEEHDYDIHDSEIVDLSWRHHDLTQVVCNHCGEDIHWSETLCDCVKDLTMHSDNELSLKVFNNQYLYSKINDPKYLMYLIKEEFVYTTKQMETLVEDLNEYLMEINVQQQLARGEAE